MLAADFEADEADEADGLFIHPLIRFICYHASAAN
jgi:hypothetical protein